MNQSNAVHQPSSNPSENSPTQGDSSTAAARDAAEQAVGQAREMAADAMAKIRRLDAPRLGALAALAGVVLMTLIFDMASFSVFSDGAVSETQAQAERSLQARMNSWSYSAFASCLTGKLMWLVALAGTGLLVYDAVSRSQAVWLPLAQAGAAIATFLLMGLLFLVGFPDLGGLNVDLLSNVRASATLFGYWLPLLASGTAAFLLVQRILKA